MAKKWLHFNIVDQNTYLQNKFVRFHLRIEKIMFQDVKMCIHLAMYSDDALDLLCPSFPKHICY